MSTHTPTAQRMSPAEIDEIMDELMDPDPKGDEWLATCSAAARIIETRSLTISAMAKLTALLAQQGAGIDVDTGDLAFAKWQTIRCLDCLEHMDRIIGMGDLGRWLLFVQTDTYVLSSADLRPDITLPRTVDREGVLQAIQIAEHAYDLGLRDGHNSLREA